MDILDSYVTRRIEFRYRGSTIKLALSHALFSSAEVDEGTRLLLKFLAAKELIPAAGSLLDGGTGVGVIGIAAKLSAPALAVHCQDRDELASTFTLMNARANGIQAERGAPGGGFTVDVGPLLGGLGGKAFDLVISNVPAKAGAPVLADFFARSLSALASGGKVAVVVVEPLAAKTLAWIAEAGGRVIAEERGKGHRVLVYGADAAQAGRPLPDLDGSGIPPPYLRERGSYSLASRKGDLEIAYAMETIYGCGEFDSQSFDTVFAAKLLLGLPLASPLLVFSPGQGHLAAALARAMDGAPAGPAGVELILGGRDSMALRASARNVQANAPAARAVARAVADIELLAEGIAEGSVRTMAVFPELCPERDWTAGAWRAAQKLLSPGGILCVSAKATELYRFDKDKPKGFSRGAELKRDGFRAQLYTRDP